MCNPNQKTVCGTSTCTVCFQRSFASHPRAAAWSAKNEIHPYQVNKNCNKKFKFDCSDCKHEIEMALHNVVKNQWCVYCNSNTLCESDDCNFCYNKSFASHEMASSWSIKNAFGPREIMKSSDKKAWFNCSKCNHDFETILFSLNRGMTCPYCTNQRLCSDQDCTSCLAKSCASHEMAKRWSLKNTLKAREMFLQSNKKVKFNCPDCEHEYETTPSHYYNRGKSCSYCDNKTLCDNETCQKCFNKSFASHERINCWSSKNTVSPRSVFKGSNQKCKFNCDKCKCEFESALYNVLTGYWCPFCKNKTEGKVLEFLSSNYSNCKTQLRFNWCRFSKTNNIMPFDFGLVNRPNLNGIHQNESNFMVCSEDHKILIELDGRQHFKQVSNWNSPEEVQVKDVEKIHKAIAEGYSIIHIYQDEVWNDKYDWKALLKKHIDLMILEVKPKVLFISKAEVYGSHIRNLEEGINYDVIHP